MDNPNLYEPCAGRRDGALGGVVAGVPDEEAHHMGVARHTLKGIKADVCPNHLPNMAGRCLRSRRLLMRQQQPLQIRFNKLHGHLAMLEGLLLGVRRCRSEGMFDGRATATHAPCRFRLKARSVGNVSLLRPAAADSEAFRFLPLSTRSALRNRLPLCPNQRDQFACTLAIKSPLSHDDNFSNVSPALRA